MSNNDSVDWKKPSPEEMTKRILGGVQNGSILLFHSGAATTLDALPGILAGLKERSYQFTTVGELLLNGETSIDHTGRQKPAK